jgi:hypothetical protein
MLRSSRSGFKPKMAIFSTGIIYSDLMKIQQGLINNNYYGHRKMMSDFIWTYEQNTHGHAKIQNKIVYK